MMALKFRQETNNIDGSPDKRRAASVACDDAAPIDQPELGQTRTGALGEAVETGHGRAAW